MAYCPSCEYVEDGICTIYTMAVARHSTTCELYQKRQTKDQKLSDAATERQRLKNRIAELEEENQILRAKLKLYEG